MNEKQALAVVTKLSNPMIKDSIEHFDKASALVRQFVDAHWNPNIEAPEYEIFSWFYSSDGQNWSMLLGVTLEDGMGYRVAYDAMKKQTTIVVHREFKSFVFKD